MGIVKTGLSQNEGRDVRKASQEARNCYLGFPFLRGPKPEGLHGATRFPFPPTAASLSAVKTQPQGLCVQILLSLPFPICNSNHPELESLLRKFLPTNDP